MTDNRHRQHAPPSTLAKAAFVLAAAALLLSVRTALRTPEARLPTPDRDAAETSNVVATATPSITNPASASPVIYSQLTALSAIEGRVTTLEQRQREIDADAGQPYEPAYASATVDEPLWRYDRLISPEPGVEVQQDGGGSVFAINSDPSLTGNVIQIEGHRPDGGIDTMIIVVPEPEY